MVVDKEGESLDDDLIAKMGRLGLDAASTECSSVVVGNGVYLTQETDRDPGELARGYLDAAEGLWNDHEE